MDLRNFIKVLAAENEIVTIDAQIDPYLEMSEIIDRVVKSEGPALYFTNVQGKNHPVVANLFGSKKRMLLALGVKDITEITNKFSEILDAPKLSKANLWGKLEGVMRLKQYANIGPKKVKSAPCQENILTGHHVNLNSLPVPTSWPQDGGPFLTLPLVITKDPVTAQPNIGMYRIQVMDENHVAVHWQIHKTGAAHFRKAKELNQKLPIAIAFGGDPALTYAATAPLPDPLDEYLFTGLIRGDSVRIVDGNTVPLMIPADAEWVLEGYIDPQDPLVTEGPFGDHTGFYSLEDQYPLMTVTAITHRHNPILPHTLVGKPLMEDAYLGWATERIFLPFIQMVIPEIVNLHMPPYGVFHNLVLVAIKKSYPGHAYKVAQGLWGLGLMSLAKVIIVVDEGIDVENLNETLWYAFNNMDPNRDVLHSKGPIDVLDHAAEHFAFGGKMVIDGTKKSPAEGATRPWPDVVVMKEEIKKRVDQIWPTLGL